MGSRNSPVPGVLLAEDGGAGFIQYVHPDSQQEMTHKRRHQAGAASSRNDSPPFFFSFEGECSFAPCDPQQKVTCAGGIESGAGAAGIWCSKDQVDAGVRFAVAKHPLIASEEP